MKIEHSEAVGPPLRGRLRATRITEAVLGRRGDVAGDLTLTRRNVFVLPTRAGLLYGLALFAMLIASINYTLSLGYALTFLLGGVAIVAMLQTFRNLSSLSLIPGRCAPVFAGQPAVLSVTVVNARRIDRCALRLSAQGTIAAETLDIAADERAIAEVAIPTTRRGWTAMPRMRIETEYPIGLWRAWAWWKPRIALLVYPVPEAGDVPPPPQAGELGEAAGTTTLDDDIAGIRPYRQGDQPRVIAWRAVAGSASDALLSKQLEGGAAGELRLDWTALPATLGLEQRISRLTRWAIDAQEVNARWSLDIPGTQLPAGAGRAHLERTLEALATLPFEA